MTRHNVKHYPLDVEIARRPRCGLCSFYPLEAGSTYECPIKGEIVHRLTKPPKARAHTNEMKHFICFHPMTELAWQTYFRIRNRREKEGAKRRRAANPQPHRDEAKLYKIENPEKVESWKKNWREVNATWIRIKAHRYYLKHRDEIKERSWLRNIINGYDPLSNVKKRFTYYRRQEKKKIQLRAKTAEEKAERKLIYETIRSYDPVWRAREEIRDRVRVRDSVEYHRWKRIIREYDPMRIVDERLKAGRERVRQGRLSDDVRRQHRTSLDDFKELIGFDDLEAFPDAPVESYAPQDIPEIEIEYSGSDVKGGVEGLWKSHPDAYRRRNLKFARLDMQ